MSRDRSTSCGSSSGRNRSSRGSSGSINCTEMMIEADTKTKHYPRGVEDCDASTDLKSGARRLRLKEKNGGITMRIPFRGQSLAHRFCKQSFKFGA